MFALCKFVSETGFIEFEVIAFSKLRDASSKQSFQNEIPSDCRIEARIKGPNAKYGWFAVTEVIAINSDYNYLESKCNSMADEISTADETVGPTSSYGRRITNAHPYEDELNFFPLEHSNVQKKKRKVNPIRSSQMEILEMVSNENVPLSSQSINHQETSSFNNSPFRMTPAECYQIGSQAILSSPNVDYKRQYHALKAEFNELQAAHNSLLQEHENCESTAASLEKFRMLVDAMHSPSTVSQTETLESPPIHNHLKFGSGSKTQRLHKDFDVFIQRNDFFSIFHNEKLTPSAAARRATYGIFKTQVLQQCSINGKPSKGQPLESARPALFSDGVNAIKAFACDFAVHHGKPIQMAKINAAISNVLNEERLLFRNSQNPSSR